MGERALENRIKKLKALEEQKKELETQIEGLQEEIKKDMERIAQDSEERFNSAIDDKISKVEPMLVALMSVIVGVILFSVMLPMMSIITSV